MYRLLVEVMHLFLQGFDLLLNGEFFVFCRCCHICWRINASTTMRQEIRILIQILSASHTRTSWPPEYTHFKISSLAFLGVVHHIAEMDSMPKKTAFRERFKEFAENNTGKQFGQTSPTTLGFELLKFYVQQIHNRTDKYISDDDFDYAVVDGSNDLGVDLLFRDDNTVIILQAKFFGSGKGASFKDIQHFQTLFRRLRDPNFTKNSRLADKVAEINFDTDSFKLRFICLGKIEGQALLQTTEAFEVPEDLPTLRDRVTLEYVDENALTIELRTALSQDGGLPGEMIIVASGRRGSRSGIVEMQIAGHNSYILIVEGNQMVNLYKQAKDRLFTLNIRNYIGNTATNRNIVVTASERPELFFHFNNGVSALARSVKVSSDGDRITTVGLQIINGAQTVKALVRAAAGKSLPPEVKVLLRLTEITQGYAADGGLANNITQYNNTQNVIKLSDFRSNDPVQNDLRHKFDYVRHGKKVEYMPKRTDIKRKINRLPFG